MGPQCFSGAPGIDVTPMRGKEAPRKALSDPQPAVAPVVSGRFPRNLKV